MVGYSEAELLHLTFQEITHPQDLDADLALAGRLVAGEIETYQMEKRYFRKDGSIIPILLSVSLVRDQAGAPLKFISQIHDRSSDVIRQGLERELSERRRADALNVLAGGLAHDFNNLLVGILGRTALALGELPPNAPVRHHLEHVAASGRRIAEVTDQMLAFSGHSWLQLADVDLGELAREVCDRLRPSFGDVTVHVSPSPGLPIVRADPHRLERITTSLLENAVEAVGDDPGTVSVSTGVLHLTRTALDSYYVGAHATPGLFAYLEIADDGCGMTNDVRDRMLEPFFTTKFQGRGLGLAVVEGLIRGHGGALAVQTAPGEGTRMRVFLPVPA
jgi:two-component system cell cycle sensor histidine kinase/response regulator CckA